MATETRLFCDGCGEQIRGGYYRLEHRHEADVWDVDVTRMDDPPPRDLHYHCLPDRTTPPPRRKQ